MANELMGSQTKQYANMSVMLVLHSMEEKFQGSFLCIFHTRYRVIVYETLKKISDCVY